MRDSWLIVINNSNVLKGDSVALRSGNLKKLFQLGWNCNVQI